MIKINTIKTYNIMKYAVFTLIACDMILTFYGINRGYREGNPIGLIASTAINIIIIIALFAYNAEKNYKSCTLIIILLSLCISIIKIDAIINNIHVLIT
jgi:hypothetical protein